MNQPMDISGVKVLAFDADDTLWDCQGHFEEATDRYCEILSPFADVETVRASLFQTETKNMPDQASVQRLSPSPWWRMPLRCRRARCLLKI